MKLISLNIWGGKVYGPLMEFIKKEAITTDIFCFQEVFRTKTGKTELDGFRLNIFSDMASKLSGFNRYMSPTQDRFIPGFDNLFDFDLNFGLATFIRKNIKVQADDFFVYGKKNSMIDGDRETLPRNVQHLILKISGKDLSIFNYHGIWRKATGNTTNKSDTPERLAASEIIRNRINCVDGEKILCGDFNLLPDTKSLAIMADGMVDLIKKFCVQTTRSKLYVKDVLKFADYTIVSNGIKVKRFEVSDITVSDHLPMILQFEL